MSIPGVPFKNGCLSLSKWPCHTFSRKLLTFIIYCILTFTQNPRIRELNLVVHVPHYCWWLSSIITPPQKPYRWANFRSTNSAHWCCDECRVLMLLSQLGMWHQHEVSPTSRYRVWPLNHQPAITAGCLTTGALVKGVGSQTHHVSMVGWPENFRWHEWWLVSPWLING